MKIIHTADLHLDSKMEHSLSYEKAKKRKNELMLAFENVVDYASVNKVKAIIIAGDIFDTKFVTQTTINKLVSIFSKNQNIDFYILSGNHDEESLFKNFKGLENVKLFTDKVTSFSYGDVVISGVNITKENTKTFYDEINLDKNKINIFTVHGQISNYDTSSKEEQNINLKKLENKNINYLALGHVHKFMSGKLGDNGIYAYSGCLEPRGFDECGEKGFVVIDTDNLKDVKFIKSAIREFVHIKVDVTNKSWAQIESLCDKELKNVDQKNLVKLELMGEYDEKVIKHIDYLQEKFNKFFFIKIVDSSSLKIDLAKLKNDKSFAGEFIRLVISSNLSDKDKNEIIECGLKALNNMEV